MKKVFFIISIIFVANSFAQCFNIETILADACGNPEGENEMVVLRIHQDLDISNLEFDWPNNSFLSWCANPTKTAQLNNTIESSCGLLLEPPMGIVPANSKLLIVSSTNMLVSANSFDGLTDTLYIIFQCAGNTFGHFSNSASSPRYLTVNFNGICTQSETVSYVATSLPGSDGAAIYYDENGDITYYNTACNAPVPTLNPNWKFPIEICNNYELIDLNYFLNPNTTTNGIWSGDIENSHFFNPEGKLGLYSITYTVNDINSCLSSVDSTIIFEVKETEFQYDTIEICDSVLYKGNWFTKDTTLYLELDDANDFTCNLMIVRTYVILKAGFSLLANYVNLESGETYDFNIIGEDLYSYSFSDNILDSCSFPCSSNTLIPNDNTIYDIFILNEQNQCSVMLKIEININYKSNIYIPNIFTPNNDGENDIFKIYGDDISEIKFEIYSKWGELLFTATDLNHFWNGMYKNTVLEDGIYIVFVSATGKDDIVYKETVNLILKR